MKNLYKKLAAAFKEIKPVVKDMTVGSGSYGYKAVSEKAVLNAVKPAFEKHNLILLPVDHETSTTINQTELNGKLKTSVFVDIKSTYELVDLDSGECKLLSGVGSGIDTQDKAVGKAMTYAYKNMLLKLFMLFSGEDTDNHHSTDTEKHTSMPVKKDKAAQPTTAHKQDLFATFKQIDLEQIQLAYIQKKRTPAQIKKHLLKFKKVEDYFKQELIKLDSELDIFGNN